MEVLKSALNFDFPIEKKKLLMKKTVSFPFKLSISLFTILTFSSLIITGIIPGFDNIYVLTFAIIIAFILLFLISPPSDFLLKNTLTFLIISGVTVVILDLFIRFVTPQLFFYRPHEMFVQIWPQMPYVFRYKANISYSSETYGDLAAISGDKTFRESRKIIFKTDAFGFRNDPESRTRKPNVLILGDSFGLGTGTTQDSIWANLLHSKYNYNIYNLSSIGGPWHHFVNLQTEFNRLKPHPDTIVLLAIFSGNDLDDFYGPVNNIVKFPKKELWKVLLSNFQEKSPVNQLIKKSYNKFTQSRPDNKVLVKKFLNGKNMLFYIPYVQRYRKYKEEVFSHKQYKHFENTLIDILRFCREKSLRLNIILIPSKVEVYQWVAEGLKPWSSDIEPSGLSSVLSSFSQDNGTGFLDLKEYLIKESQKVYENSGESLWWYDDSHFNPKGHDLMSKKVSEKLGKWMVTQ